MTLDDARWISEWATETGSLVFVWVGRFGVQPILMPGSTFLWWLDDPSLFQATEGYGGHRSRAD
jgi:hypothetical protein